MKTTLKKLSLQDLKVGMIIQDIEQLSNVYDTWIILYKKKEDSIWTIGFIGKELNNQLKESYRNIGNEICPIYNDSIELQDNLCTLHI